jgi:multiple sugar transport system substrate-binding protein
VSATSANPDAAWAFVRHLTSGPSELRFQRLIGNLPARVSAWEAPQLATPLLAPFAEQLRAPAVDPNIVEWERIRLEVQLLAEKAVRGVLTQEAALEAMDVRVDGLLAKRRALVAAGRIA